MMISVVGFRILRGLWFRIKASEDLGPKDEGSGDLGFGEDLGRECLERSFQ